MEFYKVGIFNEIYFWGVGGGLSMDFKSNNKNHELNEKNT